MTTGSVPVRYARAICAIGEERNSLPSLQREWADLAATVDASPALLPTLVNPRIPAERRRETLRGVLRAVGASPVTAAAAEILFDRGRVFVLPDVARSLDRMIDAKTGRVRAVVTTASQAPDAVHARIREALERATGRTLVVERSVDPEILGGVVAKVGDMLYDGSLRTTLARLRERLLADDLPAK